MFQMLSHCLNLQHVPNTVTLSDDKFKFKLIILSYPQSIVPSHMFNAIIMFSRLGKMFLLVELGLFSFFNFVELHFPPHLDFKNMSQPNLA